MSTTLARIEVVEVTVRDGLARRSVSRLGDQARAAAHRRPSPSKGVKDVELMVVTPMPLTSRLT